MTPFFERLKAAGFCGDIEGSASSRSVYATDNSIYQLTPAGILFPKGFSDLQLIAAVASEGLFRDISITPRGGGTGTNGQSLTSGVVVDCSRHMRRILEIDPVRRIARVEAGVVKDELNRALKPYGLFFAPELSTSNRATIGGMISTDACGQGSCLYGKTSNHVRGLRIVLMDGSEWWSRSMDKSEVADVLARDDRVGGIYRTVSNIVREMRERIEVTFPNLNRYMTGYDLAHVQRPDGRFDLNAILCGSEGTLALIAEAELNLLPLPSQAALINIRYSDFNAALEDARALVALKVASVETIDQTLLGLARRDIVWSLIERFFPTEDAKPANGVNIAEILADDEAELEQKLAEITTALDGASGPGRLGYTIARGHADVEAIWAMRKRAVGLLGNLDGPARPVAFVEDTAVPPEKLAAYIREFRAILDGAGLAYGMFGHVDAGVLHVRPALDLTRDDHVGMVRQISDAVVELTRKYGGVLWGEHGKGIRSEYVPEYFGDLYPSLQKIKHAFDPENRLNPGKIASPSPNSRAPSAPLLKIDEVPLRGATDRLIGEGIRAAFDNATLCNGNGACFDFDETSPMCPSYKATGDRRYSPKGRAMLIREWLALLAEKRVDPRSAAKRLRRRRPVLGLPRRLFNTLNPKNRGDFSHEVREAMDTCLACKACVGQCPVKVSVPTFRAKFLELYYGRYLRPAKDILISSIETILPLLVCVRPLYNLIIRNPLGARLMRIAGLTALPALPRKLLMSEAARLGVVTADTEMIQRLSASERERTVVFVPDAFTAYFDPDVVLSAIYVARTMGLLPLLAGPHLNGKALHVHGHLGRFEAAVRKTALDLQQLANTGVTLVGIDPSMTLTFRSEYKEITGAPLKAKVLMPQEWLAANLDRLPCKSVVSPMGRFVLLAHCTERATEPASGDQWRAVFGRLGIDVETTAVGCCGMAGTFGHETRNREMSVQLYGMSWAPIIAEHSAATVVMASGYSCRSQVKSIDRLGIPHPLQVLERELAKDWEQWATPEPEVRSETSRSAA